MPFLDAYPRCPRASVARRAVNLIDEGFDAALRIGELADSSMVATRIGEVRRVVVAAPSYLKQNPRIEEPGDLAKHQIISMAHIPNSWSFPSTPGAAVPRTVQFTPRLVINSTRGAVASAVGGRGVALFYSYQVAARAERRLESARGPTRRAAGACFGRKPATVPKVRPLDFAVQGCADIFRMKDSGRRMALQ